MSVSESSESSDGTKRWYRDGKLHRENGPAVIFDEKRRIVHWDTCRKDYPCLWFQNGKLHREDGPAIEYSNGDKEWYQNGEFHRDDGPAIDYSDGTRKWYQNGKLQRSIESTAVKKTTDKTEKIRQYLPREKDDNEDNYRPAIEQFRGVKCFKDINGWYFELTWEEAQSRGKIKRQF